jgi:hypothetical protein
MKVVRPSDLLSDQPLLEMTVFTAGYLVTWLGFV